MSIPFFSIIIPTHARSALLQRAIASVQSGGFDDYEMIVVSDIADRDTLLVAAELLKPSDTLVKRTGLPGPAASRNLGLDLARGKHIIFLDDDDSLQAGYLAQARGVCQQHPDSILYTNFRVIQEDRNQSPLVPINIADQSVRAVAPETLYIKNFLSFNGVIFPSALVRTKRQDPHLASLEDWDFLLNAAQDATLMHVDIFGPVVHKDYVNPGTRRGSSPAAQGVQVISDYLSIYKKWPAPTPALQQQRQDFMAAGGFRPPIEWL